LRKKVIAARRQPPAGQLEGGVPAQIAKIIRIRVAAGDGEHTWAQNVGHRMGDQRRVAMVGDECRQHADQAKLLVGPGQQQNAAVETDQAAVESGCDLLLVNIWQ
jgi:uncharacterized protein (UPF0548 family)